jgi:hypothetical protein
VHITKVFRLNDFLPRYGYNEATRVITGRSCFNILSIMIFELVILITSNQKKQQLFADKLTKWRNNFQIICICISIAEKYEILPQKKYNSKLMFCNYIHMCSMEDARHVNLYFHASICPLFIQMRHGMSGWSFCYILFISLLVCFLSNYIYMFCLLLIIYIDIP